MRDIILLGVGGYIGWYLATEEKEATLRTLKEVKQKATNLGIQLKEEAEKKEIFIENHQKNQRLQVK